MSTRRRVPVVVLSVWTLLIWTTRIGNIWSDDGIDTAGKVGRTALALSFTVLAVLALAGLWRARRAASRTDAKLVRVFALWTIGVWLVRGTGIVLGDHSAAFMIVHTVLAVVSIGLAGWAASSVRASQHPDDLAAAAPISSAG